MVDRQGRGERHLLVAMMAWRVAALQPPHLAAVVAWEGLTDFYREAARTGRACTRRGFIELWWGLQVEPQRNGADGADWREELPRHPLLDAYHEARTTDLGRVRCRCCRRELGRAAPAPARATSRAGPGRVGAQVARGPHGHPHRPVLLRLGQGAAAAVPRPLPQGPGGPDGRRRAGAAGGPPGGARRRGAMRTLAVAVDPVARAASRRRDAGVGGDGAGVDVRSPRASRPRRAMGRWS